MLVPSKEEFLRATGGTRPRAVHVEVLADVETPLSAYWKLAHDETHSFLLESVTGGEQLARYSVLGVRPREIIRSKGHQARVISREGELSRALPPGSDPLHLLKERMNAGSEPIQVPGLPVFVGGAVGMLGYDMVRFFEPRLARECHSKPPDDLGIDDMAMMLTSAVVVFDHARNLIRIIVLADPTPEAYDAAAQEIERIRRRLSQPLPSLPVGKYLPHEVSSNLKREQFEGMVERAKHYIAAGDGIQIVLSQRFSTKVQAHAVTVYRALRSINPSPYMFLLRFGEFDLVGASPELLASLHGRTARVRPIAGTRSRGQNPEEDASLWEELLQDEKERAEHIMLVDLGRNDLGRVCDYGSVKVNELMVVERYSHVMHIVSDVTGSLSKGRDAYDLLRACFPAGTVSGAPKVRAMEVIDELEPTGRGPYAGAVGFVSANGDMDTCIAIRTILLKDGVAHVQSGAGIVFDSVPSREFDETVNKARAALRAIEVAQGGLQRQVDS